MPPRKTRIKGAPKVEPWHPPEWDSYDIYAYKAVASGTANAGQQQHMMRHLINKLAGTYDLEFRETERASTFASGKRFVGLQVVKMINLPAELVPKGPPIERSSSTD